MAWARSSALAQRKGRWSWRQTLFTILRQWLVPGGTAERRVDRGQIMDRLKTIETFLATARADSFSAAARDLRQSRALVSRQIADLEGHLGVRLFSRTTREVSLTVAGQQYLEACSRFMQNLHETEAELANLQRELRGILRIISVRSFGHHHLALAIADFARLHPQLRLEMELAPGTKTSLQLSKSGFDIGIGIAAAKSVAAVPRQIAEFDWVICAGRDYLSRHGTPATLADLRQHTCMVNQRHTPTGLWILRRNGKSERVRVDARIAITNFWSLREAVLAGTGIAVLPSFCIIDDVRAGAVTPLLTDFSFERSVIRAYYPHFKSVPHKVKLFADFLRARFNGRFDLSA
jgi:DNA-binding transcriptional LysR family regulator